MYSKISWSVCLSITCIVTISTWLKNAGTVFLCKNVGDHASDAGLPMQCTERNIARKCAVTTILKCPHNGRLYLCATMINTCIAMAWTTFAHAKWFDRVCVLMSADCDHHIPLHRQNWSNFASSSLMNLKSLTYDMTTMLTNEQYKRFAFLINKFLSFSL